VLKESSKIREDFESIGWLETDIQPLAWLRAEGSVLREEEFARRGGEWMMVEKSNEPGAIWRSARIGITKAVDAVIGGALRKGELQASDAVERRSEPKKVGIFNFTGWIRRMLDVIDWFFGFLGCVQWGGEISP